MTTHDKKNNKHINQTICIFFLVLCASFFHFLKIVQRLLGLGWDDQIKMNLSRRKKRFFIIYLHLHRFFKWSSGGIKEERKIYCSCCCCCLLKMAAFKNKREDCLKDEWIRE